MGNMCSAEITDVVENAKPMTSKDIQDVVQVKENTPPPESSVVTSKDGAVKEATEQNNIPSTDSLKEAPVPAAVLTDPSLSRSAEEKTNSPEAAVENKEIEEEEEAEATDAREDVDLEDVVFWAMPISANSAVVRCFLNTCGIPYHEKNAYGLTRTKDYISKFPTNLAPAIEHGDVNVTECGAILKYLARAYPKQASRFYDERKLKDVTTIDWLLDHANTGLLAQLPKAVYPTLGFPLGPGDCAMLECTKQHTPEAIEAATQYIKKALQEKYVGVFLKDTKFLMSTSPTIADFRFAPMLNFIRVACKLPRRLEEYYDEMELLRGFKEGCQPVVDFASSKWMRK